MIVRGFIKTSAWDIVTWTRSTSDHTVTIAGGAPGYGGIDGSFSVTSGNETDPIHRSWPPHTDPDLPTNAARQIEGESADPTVLAANLPQNQTVFLSYYKVKRRPWFWQKKIEAAAGPHSLPPSPPGDAGGMFEIETESQDEVCPPPRSVRIAHSYLSAVERSIGRRLYVYFQCEFPSVIWYGLM